MSSPARRALRVAKLAFTPLALGFLGFVAWQARDSFAEVLGNARPSWLAISVFAWTAAHLCAGLFARAALLACGSRIGYLDALSIHAARLPARYLPGGFWHTVARVADFRARGVPGGHLAAFVLLENAVAACVAFTLGGTLTVAFREPDAWRQMAGLAALAGVLGLSLAPLLVARATLRGTRLRRGRYLQAVLAFVGFWFLAASAFICYAQAFPTAFSGHALPELAGAYLMAWGIGFLAVVAPQGIGVFEGVAGEMLRAELTLGGTITLVAGFRVVVLLGDLLLWSVLALLRPLARG